MQWHVCVSVCVFVHSPFEITGKRKWRNAGEHLLIAKSLGEAFDNDASGRCSSSSISADRASINAARRLNFAPKLKEFLHVVSANNINYYFSIYKQKIQKNSKKNWCEFHCSAKRYAHCTYVCMYIDVYVFPADGNLILTWCVNPFGYFFLFSSTFLYQFMRLICVYATESCYFDIYVWTFDLIFNVTLAAARINKYMYLHTHSHTHTCTQAAVQLLLLFLFVDSRFCGFRDVIE